MYGELYHLVYMNYLFLEFNCSSILMLCYEWFFFSMNYIYIYMKFECFKRLFTFCSLWAIEDKVLYRLQNVQKLLILVLYNHQNMPCSYLHL